MKTMKSMLIAIFFLTNMVHAQVDKNTIAALEQGLKQNPENTELMLKLASCYHAFAVQGEKEMVGKAEDILKKLIELEPNNAQAHCRYGSVLTIKGRDARMPFNKMRHVKDGNKEMDIAVSLDSTNISVRLTRANTSLALPLMFERIDYAITDFEYYVAVYEKAPEHFSKDQYGDVLVKLGQAYHKKGDIEKAKAVWQKVIRSMPDSNYATDAAAFIEKLKG